MADGQDLPTVVSTGTVSKGIFDFFGLPRELRNEVYSLLTKNLYLRSKLFSTGFEMRLTDAPLSQPFMLCRQFKAEYEELFKDGFTAIFKDLGSEIDGGEISVLEKAIRRRLDRATTAEIHLLAICSSNGCDTTGCGACVELSEHIDWIDDVLPELGNLEKVEVKIYKCQLDNDADSSSHQTRMEKNLDRLTEVPLICRVEVFLFYATKEDSAKVHGVKSYDTTEAPELVWKKDVGWQREKSGEGVDR